MSNIEAIVVRSPNLSAKDDEYLKTILTEVEDYDRAKVVVAAGGDNTMLSAIHEHGVEGIPFFGINLGRVGFLLNNTKFKNKDDFGLCVLESKKIHLNIIKTTIKYSGGNLKSRILFSFNDMWISPRGGQTLRMKLNIDGRDLQGPIVGDGLIISTPQGSTGYTRAAGGKIIKPSLPVVQITPKACTIGESRQVWHQSFIEKDDTVIKIEFEDFNYRPANVYYDGKEVAPQLPIESIVVEKSNRSVTLMFDSTQGFYNKIYQLEGY